MKIRILVAHPDLSQSKANQKLLSAVAGHSAIEVVDLQKQMVNGRFDIPAELEALRATDLLVWQFPLYWYNAPAVLREWQDQVLNAAVYGPDKVLTGKKLLVVTTVGARAETYRSGDLNQYTLDELLRPFETCARSARMQWLPIFAVCGVDQIDTAGWEAEKKRYKEILLSSDQKTE